MCPIGPGIKPVATNDLHRSERVYPAIRAGWELLPHWSWHKASRYGEFPLAIGRIPSKTFGICDRDRTDPLDCRLVRSEVRASDETSPRVALVHFLKGLVRKILGNGQRHFSGGRPLGAAQKGSHKTTFFDVLDRMAEHGVKDSALAVGDGH